MDKEFHDNLPLRGEVRAKGWDGVFLYLGFEGTNTRRCALVRPGEPWIIWIDRTVITPA